MTGKSKVWVCVRHGLDEVASLEWMNGLSEQGLVRYCGWCWSTGRSRAVTYLSHLSYTVCWRVEVLTVLKVSISYGELKAEFEGEPSDVYTQVLRFLEKTLPAFSLAKRIQAAVGVEELLERLSDRLAYSPGEGFFVKAQLSSQPASTAILLYAAAKHLSHLLGHDPSPEFNGSELSSVLGKPEKTVSGRLSELVQRGFLKRVGRGGYAITLLGLNSLVESAETV